MSGNKYSVTCPKCGTINEPRGRAMTLALTCKSCRIYFCRGAWNKSTVAFQHEESQAIPIGAKAKFEDHVYEVMGFAVKEETKYKYRWREYLIFNPFRGYAFLSEYNGHWNFMWPIENDPRDYVSSSHFSYQEKSYALYQKYSAEVVYAKGEFFFDVVDLTSSTTNYEYISPPHILALEKNDDSVLWCQGEYIAPKEIAQAFSIQTSMLPRRTGMGYTQPFNTSFSDKALISFTVAVILFTLLIHLVINEFSSDKIVFQGEFNQAQLTDQKVLITPSFTLNTGPRSLEVLIYAPLSNDWFFSEFSLINETTGTEYNFTKEVAHYSGYEDGYAWSEGSQTGEAFLSQIPAGTYHFNMYPEFSLSNQTFSIVVRHDVPITINFFITCFGILLFPLIYFLRRNYRETSRWSESDYSPSSD